MIDRDTRKAGVFPGFLHACFCFLCMEEKAAPGQFPLYFFISASHSDADRENWLLIWPVIFA